VLYDRGPMARSLRLSLLHIVWLAVATLIVGLPPATLDRNERFLGVLRERASVARGASAPPCCVRDVDGPWCAIRRRVHSQDFRTDNADAGNALLDGDDVDRLGPGDSGVAGRATHMGIALSGVASVAGFHTSARRTLTDASRDPETTTRVDGRTHAFRFR
jgi:hypothetical protein